MLLNQYQLAGLDPHRDDNRGQASRWKAAKAAAGTLSTEIPAMLSLARPSVRQAAREGIEYEISRADLENLERLIAALKASRPIFKAQLFQPTDPDPPRVNNRWHGLARLLASQAMTAWEVAGVDKVGIGNKAESPVVVFVQAALARMGKMHEKSAIVKVLQKWSKADRGN